MVSEGPRRVEALRPGDRVLTLDLGTQPLVWVGGAHLTAAALVVFPWGSLGQGKPQCALTVSPQHRMLLSGQMVRVHCAADAVLSAPDRLRLSALFPGRIGCEAPARPIRERRREMADLLAALASQDHGACVAGLAR